MPLRSCVGQLNSLVLNLCQWVIALSASSSARAQQSWPACLACSHLEAVNTVVLGKTRAKQYYVNDTERLRCMPILIHGDGAFSGQGIVYETLDMSGLVDYTVGGCVHLVVNNQVRGLQS